MPSVLVRTVQGCHESDTVSCGQCGRLLDKIGPKLWRDCFFLTSPENTKLDNFLDMSSGGLGPS